MAGERKIAALIAAIYDAGADVRCWPDALRLIARAFHAPTVVLGATGQRTEDVWTVAPDADPAYLARYASYYHGIDPIWRRALLSPAGTVLTDRMMIPKSEFTRTEFFSDFLVPQDLGSMLGATVYAEPRRQLHVAVQRRRDFDDADIALYARLAPHLQRAARLNVRLAQLEARGSASAEALDHLNQGTVVVDAASRVISANREAERLIGAGGCFRLVAGQLRAHAAGDTTRLQALIAGCGTRGETRAAGGSMSLSRGAYRSQIAVLVCPLRSETPAICVALRPAAIVLATDPDRRPAPPLDRIRQRFSFTPAEAAFALEILKGDGIQGAADRIGISCATARTHLSHIFRKTDARRQAELVRLLMQT